MCFIIDVCVFQEVSRKQSGPFTPIREWLTTGKGVMVYGGSKYECQLRAMVSYLGIIAELKKKRKVVVVDKCSVDKREKEIFAIQPNAGFDDAHLIAIVEVSRCRIICTVDTKADRYLLDRKFYHNAKKPKIYRHAAHASLLRDENIVGACA